MSSTANAALMAGGAVGVLALLLGTGFGWALLLGAGGAIATKVAIDQTA
jgi:hypothetical protein